MPHGALNPVRRLLLAFTAFIDGGANVHLQSLLFSICTTFLATEKHIFYTEALCNDCVKGSYYRIQMQ